MGIGPAPGAGSRPGTRHPWCRGRPVRPGEATDPLSVVVVGLEHERTPLDLLERVTVGDAELGKVLGTLRDRANLSESVVLSTCLRTEVYAVVDRFHDAVHEIHEILAEKAGVEVGEMEEHASVRFDDDGGGPPVLGGLGAGVGGARRGRGAGPGAQGLGAGPGRAGGRARPLRALPPRPADRQAGALGDRHRPRDHLVLARRGGAGRVPPTGRAGRRDGGGGGGGGDGRGGAGGAGVAVPRPASGRGAGGQPHGGPGRQPGPRPCPRGSRCAPSAWPNWRPPWPGPTSWWRRSRPRRTW